MTAKRSTRGTNSLLLVAIVLAALVAVNLISQRRFFRIDLTEDRRYTLSSSTKKILKDLDDVVTVKVYFSRELPTYLMTLNQEVRDMLAEYGTYSGGNLLVEWEDPAENPETESRVRFLGIPQVQLQIIEKDQMQAVNAYLGVAVLYEDRSETIPVVESVENLEYDLTAAILKVFRDEEETVAVLQGDGVEPTLEEGLANARQALAERYRVLPYDPAGGEPVPAEAGALLVVQPDALSDRTLFEIDQFVMAGGSLLLFYDPIRLTAGSIRATPRLSGMEEMLARWGVRLGENVVLDPRDNQHAAFNQGYLTFTLPYPFWLNVRGENVNPANPIVNQLGGIVLPWAGTVAAAETPPEGIALDTLLWSSSYAWTRAGEYDLNPQQRFADAPREPGARLPLAVAATGVFPGFFAGKEIPPLPADREDGSDPTIAPPPQDRSIIESSDTTRVVVFGSGNMILDDMTNQFRANLVLLQNAVDWLSFGDELIAIRSRGVSDRPLREMSERGKTIARFLTTFGVPILVVLFGLARWIRRRNLRAEALAAMEASE
ncbi:MAG: GldG family protein [Candidatus Eisenbacteria bacterium]|nr:GldG family protein [Candidatus Eisenbacteria bacterium]